jgi:hypothetical protein
MLTMLLGGLWHGASWTFLLWGGLHGGFLVAHRFWSRSAPARWLAGLPAGPRGLWRLVAVGLTFHCVCLAWVFFRLPSMSQSLVCIHKWFVFDANKLFVGGSDDLSLWLLLGLYGLLAGAAHALGKVPAWGGFGGRAAPAPLARGFLWGSALGLLILAVLLSPGGDKPPFIYFQF